MKPLQKALEARARRFRQVATHTHDAAAGKRSIVNSGLLKQKREPGRGKPDQPGLARRLSAHLCEPTVHAVHQRLHAQVCLHGRLYIGRRVAHLGVRLDTRPEQRVLRIVCVPSGGQFCGAKRGRHRHMLRKSCTQGVSHRGNVRCCLQVLFRRATVYMSSSSESLRWLKAGDQVRR